MSLLSQVCRHGGRKGGRERGLFTIEVVVEEEDRV
jgi:hypothetical protein